MFCSWVFNLTSKGPFMLCVKDADGYGRSVPSSVYNLYITLSVFWELADANADVEYETVPPGTVKAVLRFEQKSFHK